MKFFFFNLLTLERERGRGKGGSGERERFVVPLDAFIGRSLSAPRPGSGSDQGDTVPTRPGLNGVF